MTETDIIPTYTDSYNSLIFVHTGCASVYKKIGYTPLQVLESIRTFLKEDEKSKCTYVGRLDPMAEGWMHVLWNGDMEEKKRLASLDKVYEIDVLLGMQTDTGDALGLIINQDINVLNFDKENIEKTVKSFIGVFSYPYPDYSSPQIKKTLKGEVQEIRLQKGNIDKIDIVRIVNVSAADLFAEIQSKLMLCHMPGDFRLALIQEGWKSFFENNNTPSKFFTKITLRVYCGSGTYMRTLASELGKNLGSFGFALGIRRIGVGKS